MSNESVGQLIESLVNIMNELRERCPWDRKQTLESLRQMTLEEVYELAETIDAKDYNGLKEELGDLLLHIVFYSKIAAEQKQFTLSDVIQGINEKLVRRHPHIWPPAEAIAGLETVQTDDEVKRNWEKIKKAEGKTSVLSGVPKALPALVKALRIQEKAKQVGFEWQAKEQVWEKVEEELAELSEAVAQKSQKEVESEFGDVLFSLLNYARFLNIDAEHALEQTNQKFISRFTAMEKAASNAGLSLTDMNLVQMDELWNKAKQTENPS